MLLTPEQLRTLLAQAIDDATDQGHATEGLREELGALPQSYDSLVSFAARVADLPLRDDWPYVEPDDLGAIGAESATGRAGSYGDLSAADARDRIVAAFLGRVCGCMLGKPFEIDVTLDAIRVALTRHDEWPLADYPTEDVLRTLPTLQGQWRELARGRIAHVVPDDDINYTILAMLALETRGSNFTHDDLRQLWLYNLPVLATFGPERTTLIRSAIQTFEEGSVGAWRLDPGRELCGALIRADAYGYACLGRPKLAAELAHRDASFTHSRTGVYGAMFVAAAIAIAPFVDEPLEIFREALRFVPQRSRFAERTRECLQIVEHSDDWLDGYATVNQRFGEFGFCRIYQEIGTVINTLRFASDIGDGICMQVMQGNDTDSFGATAGSILGAFFGPGHLDNRWVRPFNDRVHTALASFHEQSLQAITERMAALPSVIANRG